MIIIKQAMMRPSVGPLKIPRYNVWVWYVSHVEKYMARQGMMAVKMPAVEVPKPMAATSSRLARVQLRESIP